MTRLNTPVRTLTMALGGALAAVTLASCAPMGSADPAELTPDQLATLDRHLGGKVAGQPVRCITQSNADQTIRVSDAILLYRVSGRLVYRNDLRGTCPGLARDSDIMVFTNQTGMGPCAGDFFHLVDRSSGIRGPSCTLGEFTPYRTPEAE